MVRDATPERSRPLYHGRRAGREPGMKAAVFHGPEQDLTIDDLAGSARA